MHASGNFCGILDNVLGYSEGFFYNTSQYELVLYFSVICEYTLIYCLLSIIFIEISSFKKLKLETDWFEFKYHLILNIDDRMYLVYKMKLPRDLCPKTKPTTM